MLDETTFEISPQGFIEVHYATRVTLDNQTKFLEALRTLISKEPKFYSGVEFLIDMTLTRSYSEEAQKLAEDFVRDIKITHTATYGASEDVKSIREKFYAAAGKGDRTHYFPSRKEALAWIFAERAVNDIVPITENSNKIHNTGSYWSTLIITDPRYIELIYTVNVDLENQNRLMNEVENYAETVKTNNGSGINLLIDMSKTQTFTDGAQMRTASMLQSTRLRKVAVFGATDVMKVIRTELYKTCKCQNSLCYFATRKEALKWLLSD